MSADRIVSTIKGNDDRLVAAVDVDKGIVWITWIGANAAFDRIDVPEVEHGG